MKIHKLLAGVAALCLLGVTSGCSLLGIGSDPRDPSGEATASGKVDAFSLRVGDCIISSDLGNSFSEVPLVPCTEAHDAEIIYIFDIEGSIYNKSTIEDAAWDQCEKAMTDYVGPNYDKIGSEGLDISYFSPTADSWKNGDREVDCIAYTVSEKNELTSSVKGAGV